MDSLADLWIRSGKNTQRLFRGSTDEMVEELKAWVERRKANNDARMEASWNTFRAADSLHQLSDQLEGVQEGQLRAMMDIITSITAAQYDHLDRVRVSHLPNS